MTKMTASDNISCHFDTPETITDIGTTLDNSPVSLFKPHETGQDGTTSRKGREIQRL